MNINVEVVNENEDGTTDVVVNFDKEGMEILIEAGVLSILKQYIDKQKEIK